jgi:hypothetical protein
MFRGIYQEVVVDDYVPVGNNSHPLFAKPTKKNEIWVMILEKCWAKLFGSYENTISKFNMMKVDFRMKFCMLFHQHRLTSIK